MVSCILRWCTLVCNSVNCKCKVAKMCLGLYHWITWQIRMSVKISQLRAHWIKRLTRSSIYWISSKCKLSLMWEFHLTIQGVWQTQWWQTFPFTWKLELLDFPWIVVWWILEQCIWGIWIWDLFWCDSNLLKHRFYICGIPSVICKQAPKKSLFH